MRKEKIRIGDLLKQHNLITEEQLNHAIAEQKHSGSKLGAMLVDLGYIDEIKLLSVLAGQLEIPFIDLNAFNCQTEVVQKLPEIHARRFRAIVLEYSDSACVIGMVDPQNIFAVDELTRLLGRSIEIALVQESALLNAYELFYDYSQEISRFAEELSIEIADTELLGDNLQNLSAADAPVVRLLHSVFEEAIRLKASDIHIEPNENTLLIRLRVDGVLQEQVVKERNVVGALTQRLKLMAGLNIAEKRLPQDGRFHITMNKHEIDIRLATMPLQHGEAVVMRLLRKLVDHATLDDLLMPTPILKRVRRIMRSPHGMFLVTGPTGSGKTTTLYSVLQELNLPAVKIITVEDPVEYRLDRICQVQVNPKIDLTFARVLRSMLRHDPDIIMIGELRDKESADIALRAAMTGHLVLATLHTNDAYSSAIRLIDMGIESYLVASALRGVLAQRLLRRICSKCSGEHELTEIERHWLQAKLGVGEVQHTFKQGKGCAQCNHTGYAGRQGVYELMVINDQITDALRSNDALAFSRAAKQDSDGSTLDFSALQLAYQGITSLQEVMRISETLDSVPEVM